MIAQQQPKYFGSLRLATSAEARENIRREANQKAARKAAKELQKRIAADARAARQRAHHEDEHYEEQSNELSSADTTKPVFKGVIKMADPKETERMRAENAARDAKDADATKAALLKKLRTEAEVAAKRIYDWMVDTIPSRDAIVRELTAALFVPVAGSPTAFRCEGVVIHTNQVELEETNAAYEAKKRVLSVLAGTDFTAKLAVLADEGFDISHQDDRGNTVFARSGVEVTLYGSNAGNPNAVKRFGGRMNEQQQLAANRRANGGKSSVEREALSLLGIGSGKEKKPRGSAGMSKEEMAAAAKKNAELNAQAKATRKANKSTKLNTPKVDKKAKKEAKEAAKNKRK